MDKLDLVNDVWLKGRPEQTVKQYHRAIKYFSEYSRLSVEELKKRLENKKQLAETCALIRGFKDFLQHKGLSPNSTRLYLSALKDFSARVALIKIPKGMVDLGPQQVITERAILRNEDILGMLQFCNAKERAVLLLQWSSGQAVNEIAKMKVPTGRVVKAFRSKAGTSYRFCITEEAKTAIDAYVKKKHLQENDPLWGKIKVDSFTLWWQRRIKHLAKLSGLDEKKVSPHCLRSAFSSIAGQTTLSDYLMGHKIPYNGAYFKKTDEELLAEYDKEIAPRLFIAKSDEKTKAELEDLRLRLAETERRLEGYAQQLDKYVTEEVEKQIEGSQDKTATNGGGSAHRIIANESELLEYLNQGWTLVSTLPNGKFVIKL